MEIHESSKTKIIATIGPASAPVNKLQGLIYSGIDLCRLNFSHGSYREHEEVILRIKEINERLGSHIALLADLQGPKIRLGTVEEGVEVQKDDEVILSIRDGVGTKDMLPINYPELPGDVKKGDILLVDDGTLKFRVESTNGKDQIKTRVIYGGSVKSHKGVNLPHTKISIPSLTEKDKRDVDFILDHDFDWIALSFVRSAKDILGLKKIIRQKKKNTLVIAKIEKPEALDDLDEIIAESDAVMVARGDLGVEVSFEKVPLIQKQIVQKCIQRSTPVIIATQMLESMIYHFRPTRAEANDVANAVFDCADTVMLSGETSVGNFPVESIQCMQRIIDYAEGTGFVHDHSYAPSKESDTYLQDSACYNACKMADQSGAKAIVAFAAKPQTAFRLACNRPNAPIYIFTHDPVTRRQMSLVWGVKTFYIESNRDMDSALEYSIKTLKNKKLLDKGDLIVQVSSIPLFDFEGVSAIKLSYV